jgi:hypothetical protein
MDGLTFAAEVIKALAWPASVIASVLLLKKPLANLLPRTSSVKYGELEVEFGREIGELHDKAATALPAATAPATPAPGLEDRLVDLLAVSPNAAVLAAWREVERAALLLVDARGSAVDTDTATPYKTIQEQLARSDLVQPEKVQIFDDLRRLRNKVAHAPGLRVSTDSALEFIEVALALVAYLHKRVEQAAG